MATSAVIDLVSDDDDNTVDLGHTRYGAQVQRTALNRTIVPDTLQPRRRSGFSSALAIATIDLTLEDDAAAGVAERPGSAGEGDLAPANEARPDSRSRNQNTSPRTPRTTAEGSSKPRASVSGDTDVAPKLTRVSAKTPPAALNSESPPMFPGRFAHLPGNPSGERHSGASASSTRPPPLNDGSTPAQAHVISDDEDGDNGDDDDLLIDEEKSTPATASRDTLSSGRSTEHVRPTTPPTPPSERETSPIKRLSPIAAEVAERVKQDWGVYPWEIATALNPPQFDATLVCDFCDLARDGCSLEKAKQLVEDQVKNRSAKLDGGPGYIITDDIKEARKIFNNLKKPSEEEQRGSSPETVVRPETDGARDRGNETLSNSIQPEELHPEPQDDNPLEALDSTPKDLLPIMSTEAKPTEHADITQTALPVTLLDMGSTESPKSNSCKVPPRDIPTSESFQDLQDTSGWSIESMRDLLNKRVKEIDEDREYFTKFRLGRARRIHHFPEPDTTAESSNDFISGPSIVPAKFAQQEFPWPNATAIQTRGAVKTGESKPRNQKTQEVFSHGSSKGIRSIISNPVDFYAVNTVPVPPYTNYVSLKQNVLAENHRTLMVYPYFDDNQDEDLAKKSLWDELQSRYNIVADELRRRRYNDALYRQKCGNVNIQRNVPKRTLLGQSEVQGFGLYAGERLKAGEYIGEYKGEIVTKEEAQEVDSTRAGNKLRFINNSAKAPNCEPRVMLCNTVVRIGLFANKDMAPGEEMFFNYNYPEEVTKHFWEKGQTQSGGTAFAVKTKKGGGKQKGKAANLSSDSEALASRRSAAPPSVSEALAMQKGLKAKKSAPKVKAEESSRSRIGETPLRGSSTISRYAWATTGKRPRRTALEKQKAWEELEEVLEDFDSFGESDQNTDSENDRPKKKGKKAKV
ncbi:Histone-lysine N-methyltransferase E(z) [Lasiodiplodia hormozganensis]|uniref:Histone-lysine N-methyltransferase E(Z) n=1 Tax=Lasiodiplodia hormozganensis TaxID=869390 RepID=A0AA39XVT0_9PEZI|nr:Histone-lysine N-methyltransferase E(z) [Lasiodiplodia hormozganensis]